MTRMWAYIDETGDPGGSRKSSEAFGMAAIVFGDSGAKQCRALVEELRARFKVPHGKPLSWKEHSRKHEDRKFVAGKLAQLTDVTVLYVYCRKTEVETGEFTKDRSRFYNYVAGKLHKGILWAARNAGCEQNGLVVRYGQIMGFDHNATTLPYFKRAIHRDAKVPDGLIDHVKWVHAATYAESQIADLFAGCLNSAITQDKYGAYEGQYLHTVWPLIRNSHSCSIPLGLMSIPKNHLVTGHEWFPCQSCKHVVA